MERKEALWSLPIAIPLIIIFIPIFGICWFLVSLSNLIAFIPFAYDKDYKKKRKKFLGY